MGSIGNFFIVRGVGSFLGDKSFETQPYRDTERDAGQLFEKARETYSVAVNSGEPKHRWETTIAAEAVHLPRRRVHDWAMKHGNRREKPSAL